jgi:hypothetical protein
MDKLAQEKEYRKILAKAPRGLGSFFELFRLITLLSIGKVFRAIQISGFGQ